MEKTESKIIPFPQANDFKKVFLLLEIEDENNLKNNDYLSTYLGVSPRQINYYLSACEFLDLISKREFTEYGINLRSRGLDHKIASISSRIISKPVFGEVFFYSYFYGEKMPLDQVADLIVFSYGEALDKIAERRASTVTNWVKWINSNKKV